ncbi:uncharacterized protein TRAVEDRAFT_86254, partial [Trametes versicolor FP-101664 SS1]|uniref:uncharacterized protein n=1 Tax=Trametes versicolor (strain FP-101664) TaxID=717944 RepID=UPI00046231F7
VPIFRMLWGMQYPVVVHGIQKKLQGNWAPQSFAQSYGDEEALMLHSASPTAQKVTVKTFFTEFVRSHEERGGTIKLKDWPPSASFADLLKPLCKAFFDAVPMADYTGPDGILNLITHYPEPLRSSATMPDVGPKLYSSTQDVAGVGSTKLHLDVTSAVNILVHTSGEGVPGALWHIFLAADTDKLRAYLRSKSDSGDDEDPVHAQ